MPSGRSKIQYRVVCTGDGGREWRVYKLKRQYRLFKKVRLWSNARLELHVPDKKPRKPEFLRRENGARTDARVWVKELGGYVYFHRLVAYAWQRGRYQVEGGAWVDLAPDAKFEDLAHLHVEHGRCGEAHPYERVLVDELSFVTAGRNHEIEKERKEARKLEALKKLQAKQKARGKRQEG